MKAATSTGSLAQAFLRKAAVLTVSLVSAAQLLEVFSPPLFWLHPWHMEVPGPRIKSELQLRPTLWQPWICNPRLQASV